MAWEVGYAVADAVLGAGSAAVEYGPRAALVGGVAYAATHKERARQWLEDADALKTTAIRDATHPVDWFAREGVNKSKRVRLNDPSKFDQVSRASGNLNMGLLTYQRQTASYRGRSRRRVRRLARQQRRSALRGSSSNLIANTYPIIFPVAGGDPTPTTREGGAGYTYLVPSLAQVVEEVSRVWAQSKGTGDRLSGSFNISIPKQRFSFTCTPDWPSHETSAVAVKLTLYKFRLSKKCPINDVIATPVGSATTGDLADMNYYFSTNYVTSVPSCINGLPYDHTEGIRARYAAASNTGTTPSATEFNDTRKDPLTIFESPAAMAKINMSWAKDFYIPYGQSMSFSCGHGPIRINYADLEINRPEKFEAKTYATGQGDNFITPFLPAGWPVFIIKVQKHLSAGDKSLTNLGAADAINVSHRLYYRVPNFPGRMLTYNNPNSTSRGAGDTVPRYANVSGGTNGIGKTAAYTGLNI